MLLKGKRIFLTEDNLTNRSVIQLLLERDGAIFAFERWGTETTERLQKFAPVDIILLDLMLPNNITGLDLFDQIRAMPGFEHVPIAAVSAKDPSIAIPEVQAKGFDGFIAKPINRLRFAHQIASIIAGEKIWQGD
jgi:CheY-like chemotaxis protein